MHKRLVVITNIKEIADSKKEQIQLRDVGTTTADGSRNLSLAGVGAGSSGPIYTGDFDKDDPPHQVGETMTISIERGDTTEE